MSLREDKQYLLEDIIYHIPLNRAVLYYNMSEGAFYGGPQPLHGQSVNSKYFVPILWQNGFEDWNLARFETPGDGNCLFHALLNSFFIPYITGKLQETEVTPELLVKAFRKKLSEKLDTPRSDGGPTYYQALAGGELAKQAIHVREYELPNMQKLLNSDAWIGYGYMEYIGDICNKDIYILEGHRHDLYVSDELRFCIKGNRNSIVLYYCNSHYEPVGILDENNKFQTLFSPNHSFIRFLKRRVDDIINYSDEVEKIEQIAMLTPNLA
jgi:hypothetical protein